MALVVKNPPAKARDTKDPWVREILWRRPWRPTPVFLPGESHGQKSLVGYRPLGRKESDTTEETWHSCMSLGDDAHTSACDHQCLYMERDLPLLYTLCSMAVAMSLKFLDNQLFAYQMGPFIAPPSQVVG